MIFDLFFFKILFSFNIILLKIKNNLRKKINIYNFYYKSFYKIFLVSLYIHYFYSKNLKNKFCFFIFLIIIINLFSKNIIFFMIIDNNYIKY